MSCLHTYEHPMFCALSKPPEEPFLFILHILSSCLKKILLIDSLCSPFGPTFVCSSSVLFDSLAPARLALRANLRLLYLKGPAFSIVSSVVNSAGFGLMQDWSK